jgi:thiol:disulfide interchange protein DsbC
MKFMKIFAILLGALLGANVFFENRDKLEDYIDDEIALANLPTSQAIKYVKGTGKPVLATFEDPNCPYCANLDEQLYALDNVTIYIFLTPILSDDSWEKSRRIWCASVPLDAWRNWMLKQQEPSNAANCDVSAFSKNIAMLQKLDASGVPYVLMVKD